MRRYLLAALGAGALVAGSALAAQAMPVGSTSEATPMVTNVMYGDGCGPRRVRGPYGGCRWVGGPGYGPRPYWGGPRFYGPRPFYGPPRPYYRPYW